MGTSSKYTAVGGVRYTGVGNFLLGGVTSSSVVCIRVLFIVGDYDEGGGGNPCSITKEDKREEVQENYIRDMGDSGGRRGVEGGWDAYVSHIHWPQEGGSGAVGGSKTYI